MPLMAATPPVPLTLPYIKHIAYASLVKVANKTRNPARAKKSIQLKKCVRTNAQHGSCFFAIVVTLKGSAVCVGHINVRDIGHGTETMFSGVACAPVKEKS